MAKKIISESLLWIGVLAFLFLFGSGMVISPFYGDINLIDEGQFGTWITHLRHGEYLYKDTYAAYGPLYIYPGYLLTHIFEPSVFLIRMTYFVLNVFLALLIVRTFMHSLRIRKRIQFFVIFLLLIIPGLGMRQGSGLLVMLLVHYAFCHKNKVLPLLAGLSLGMSFLISVEIGLFTLVITLVYISVQAVTAQNETSLLQKVGLLVIGLLTVFTVFYAWSSSQGWFGAYVTSMLDDLQTYSGMSMPVGQAFPNLFSLVPQSFKPLAWVKYLVSKELLLYWLFLTNIVALLLLLFAYLLKKSQPKDLPFLLLVVYSFALSTILIGRSGHFTFTLAPAFIILGVFIDRLFMITRRSNDKSEKSLSVVLLLVIFLFLLRIVLIYRPHFPEIFPAFHAVFSEHEAPAYVGNIRLSNAQERSIRQLQQFVWSNTDKSERIFFFSNTPMYYFLVDRLPPARFDIPETIHSKEQRLALLNTLISDKTRYIIEDTSGWDVDGVSNRERLPEVITYIEENYDTSKIGHYVVYTKREL